MKIENVAVISLEDYAEYMELKADKNKVDYSKLKKGSVVRLNLNDNHLYGGQQLDIFNMNLEFEVLIVNSEYSLFNKQDVRKRIGYNDITFIQNGKTIVYDFGLIDKNFIAEVISY